LKERLDRLERRLNQLAINTKLSNSFNNGGDKFNRSMFSSKTDEGEELNNSLLENRKEATRSKLSPLKMNF